MHELDRRTNQSGVARSGETDPRVQQEPRARLHLALEYLDKALSSAAVALSGRFC